MQAISLYWFASLLQTSTFRPRKIGLLYVKFSEKFSEISGLFSKSKRKWQKMTKSKVVQKSTNFRCSQVNG